MIPIRHSFVILTVLILHSAICTLHSHAATVTGTLTDISIQALDTQITFSPTNDVLVNASGLSAGPPRTIQAANGSFSLTLDAGDYSVSLPLIPWRRPFRISVPVSNSSFNITNLLAAPLTYTYTNNLNYTLKVEPDDAAANYLDQKLLVSGGITKTLTTNSGVVTMTLGSSGGGASNPLHVNVAALTVLSSDGETSLFDSSCTLGAGTLSAGKVISIEAFGSYADPDNDQPAVTFTLRLGSTVIASETKSVIVSNWHLRALVTLRTAGASASAVGALFVHCDEDGAQQFNCDSQTATVDTTSSLTLSLSATVQNFSGAEGVTCSQLIAILN